jgi:hypothetical protein
MHRSDFPGILICKRVIGFERMQPMDAEDRERGGAYLGVELADPLEDGMACGD